MSLYSDVVAARPPSPLKETPSNAVASTVVGPDNVGVPSQSKSDEAVSRLRDKDNNVHYTSSNASDEGGLPQGPEDQQWTIIERRRARSPGSRKKDSENPLKTVSSGVLTQDQTRTIDYAIGRLTQAEKHAIAQRQKNLNTHRGTSPSSRGEGNSNAKGKTIDPREWGDVNISRESLDIEAQTAALRSFAQHKDNPTRRVPSGRPSHGRSQSPRLPAESRPVAQVAKNSYLGMALHNVGRESRKHKPRGRNSPSPSGSDSSDGSYPSSGDEEGLGPDEGSTSAPPSDRPRRRRDNRHGRHKERRRRSSSSRASTVIKPIPPKEYDGCADARAYHRFVRESEAYLRDGRVRGRRQVFQLSYYLTGKAYDFYTQKVASNEEEWTLREFYNELFNYCFPVDYRMQIRRTLARCHQNERSVAEYTHELHELFNMIGDISERDQVLKFWNGARTGIQKELWRNNLNPEISSWNQVTAQAEIIEIAENVADRRDRRAGSSSAHPPGANRGPSESGSRPRHKSTDRSVRAVSFEARRTGSQPSGNRFPSKTPSATSSEHHHSRLQSRESSVSARGRSGQRGRSQTPRYRTNEGRSSTRMSDKERAELLAAGKCFICKETGHLSRNCPHRHTVRSDGPKPPGTSSYNIELLAPSQEVDESVEVLDSLPLGALFFEKDAEHIPLEYLDDPSNRVPVIKSVWPGPRSEWKDHYPCWQEPEALARRRLGDCFLMVADAILTVQQPYPGDERYEYTALCPELRFVVTRNPRNGGYNIQDRLANSHVTVAQALLEHPQFDISRWYAKRRIQFLNLQQKPTHHHVMGDAISQVATKLLTDGISSLYPCTNPTLDPEKRFRVRAVRAKGRGDLEEYSIDDADFNHRVYLATSWLKNPLFNLAYWYKDYINQYGQFETCYLGRQFLHPDDRTEQWEEVASAEGSESWEGVEPETDPEMPELILVDDDVDDPEMPELVLVDDEDDFDCMPELVPVSDDEEPGHGDQSDTTIIERVTAVLLKCQPFPGDEMIQSSSCPSGETRFSISLHESGLVEVYDRVQGFETHIHRDLLDWNEFSLGKWFAERCACHQRLASPWTVAQEWMDLRNRTDTTMGGTGTTDEELSARLEALLLSGVQIDRNKYPSLQRNAAQVKGNHRILPKPLVIKVMVNGHPARALLDSGSLGDFMSSTLADQLSIKRKILEAPLSLQLAVQGSRSKVNATATVRLKYQDIDEERSFDIININSYDLILGTPWMYQHRICLGFNPARIVIGSDETQPLKAGVDTKLMVSLLSPEEREIEKVREELRNYAEPLCKEVYETDLPPFRAINHTIPLIDESKTYPWRPSRCPEAFRAQWAEKRDAYLKSERWKITSAGNTVPMLLIPKPGTAPPELRTVVDLRERNKNTQKLTSPLPDIDGMLRRTAKRRYRSTLDMKSAYEQIRIVPEHVPRSTVTTPDGNMVSQVIQIGDCNAPATYQALMNHLFSAYIGRFMDIYLDDIVVYSDDLNEHVQHVKCVLDILKREKLYLSRSKLHFVQPVLKLLGRIIDDHGIRMDTDKVDSVINWKVPTNRDLLRGFIGSVGYLADDIPNVRIPMGILSSLTGDTVPFRWDTQSNVHLMR